MNKFGIRRRRDTNREQKPELIKVAVTGPRPENMAGVPAAYIRSNVRDTLEVMLEDHDGLVHAYSGMARGVDTIFATQALRMGIPLYAVIPFQDFDAAWDDADRRILENLLQSAKHVETVCDIGSKAAFQARNMWLVDNCDLLLAYHVPGKTGGTANCIAYARSVVKSIRATDITKLFPTLDKSQFS